MIHNNTFQIVTNDFEELMRISFPRLRLIGSNEKEPDRLCNGRISTIILFLIDLSRFLSAFLAPPESDFFLAPSAALSSDSLY